MAFSAVLSDRAAIRVSGDDAPHFLHNLITNSVEDLAEGEAAYAALLTPQGKIISDFLVLRVTGAYLIDVPQARCEEIRKRLTLYKLRAKAAIAVEDVAVAALWDTAGSTLESYADPRLPELGFRAFLPRADAKASLKAAGFELRPEADYHAHRIALGVPEGGKDFAFEDAFPHEADMDQLHGVDFRKGCYVGQEVVSRMQHRSTARTRIVPISLSETAEPGTDILAGDKTAGKLGSVSGERGIALIRIDRADDALAKGKPLTAGTAVITPQKPAWARFRFPGEPVPDAAQ